MLLLILRLIMPVPIALSGGAAFPGDLTVARGIALAAFAIFIGLLIAQGWMLLHLLRQHGRMMLRIEAIQARSFSPAVAPPPVTPDRASTRLPLGTPAPAFSLPDLDNRQITLDHLLEHGNPVLLVFADPGSSRCIELLPDLAGWERAHAERLTIAVISRGSADANRAIGAGNASSRVLLQRDHEVADAYHAPATPTAVLVSPRGVIANPGLTGIDAIRGLVERAARKPASAPRTTCGGGKPRGPELGAQVPASELAAAHG